MKFLKKHWIVSSILATILIVVVYYRSRPSVGTILGNDVGLTGTVAGGGVGGMDVGAAEASSN